LKREWIGKIIVFVILTSSLTWNVRGQEILILKIIMESDYYRVDQGFTIQVPFTVLSDEESLPVRIKIICDTLTCSVEPSEGSTPLNCTLSITTDLDTIPGTYNVTIVAETLEGYSVSKTIMVEVAQPNVSITNVIFPEKTIVKKQTYMFYRIYYDISNKAFVRYTLYINSRKVLHKVVKLSGQGFLNLNITLIPSIPGNYSVLLVLEMYIPQLKDWIEFDKKKDYLLVEKCLTALYLNISASCLTNKCRFIIYLTKSIGYHEEEYVKIEIYDGHGNLTYSGKLKLNATGWGIYNRYLDPGKYTIKVAYEDISGTCKSSSIEKSFEVKPFIVYVNLTYPKLYYYVNSRKIVAEQALHTFKIYRHGIYAFTVDKNITYNGIRYILYGSDTIIINTREIETCTYNIPFSYKKFCAVTVVKEYVDEGFNKTIYHEWIPEGQTFKPPSSWTKTEESSETRYIPATTLRQFKVTSPITITIPFYTYYKLTVASPYGRYKGAGWYRKNSEVEFGIEDTLVPYPGNDTLSTILRILGVRKKFVSWKIDNTTVYNPKYKIIVDSPKEIIAEWEDDYTNLIYGIIIATVPILGVIYLMLTRKCAMSLRWLDPTIEIAFTCPRPGTTVELDDLEPLPMRVDGCDKHFLEHICRKTGLRRWISKHTWLFYSNLEFIWRIKTQDGGVFISKESDRGAREFKGRSVLYLPPYLDLEKRKNVIIEVEAVHNDPTKLPKKHSKKLIITLRIERLGKIENVEVNRSLKEYRYRVVNEKYRITVIAPMTKYVPPSFPVITTPIYPTCSVKGAWKADNEIAFNITCPSEVACGEKVILKASGKDTDTLELCCTGTNRKVKLKLSDLIEYEWRGPGRFPVGTRGDQIVWVAPKKPGEYELIVTASNLGLQINDKPKTKKVKVKVVKLGIRGNETPKRWLPTPVSELSYDFEILKCVGNRWVRSDIKRRVKAKLETSHEKGVCLNFGLSENPDLWFPSRKIDNSVVNSDYCLSADGSVDDKCNNPKLNKPIGHKHYLLAFTKEPVSSGSIVVRSEDFGSYGVLSFYARNCVEVRPKENGAHRQVCREDEGKIKIPYDKNGNNIPDDTPWDRGNPTDDNDEIPIGNGVRGDNLSNYDEYRGFIILRTLGTPIHGEKETVIDGLRHVRTSIRVKDIFIHSFIGMGNFEYFLKTGLRVHFIEYSMYNIQGVAPSATPPLTRSTWSYGDMNMLVNYNRRYASSYRCYGLQLVGRSWASHNHPDWVGNYFGVSHARNSSPKVNGPPSYKDAVFVDVQLNRNYKVVEGGVLKSTIILGGVNVNVGDMKLKHSIAHELGHAVNLWHHGENYDNPNERHGVTSGVYDCVMRYFVGYTGWKCNIGGTPHTHPYPHPRLPGKVYCDKRDGTRYNAVTVGGVKHSNDAATNRGDCIHKIQVSNHSLR